MRTKAYRYYVSSASSSSSGGGSTVTSQAGASHNHSEGSVFISGNTTTGGPGHEHNFAYNAPQSFTGSENGHTHAVDTTHGHSISTSLTPGIVETTTPSAMTVAIDGNVIPGTATSLDEFDMTPYLTRAADGSIVRGLHQITFTPNANGRVQATIKGMLFLQSRGAIVG
jgi:hypothetical protein